jgi:hypothetical protein
MASNPSVPEAPPGRKLGAREALLCVGLTTLLLIVFGGAAIRDEGLEMKPGWERTMVLAFGHPAGWVADQLPFADAAGDATAFLNPDDDLSGAGFDDNAPTKGIPPVGPEAFEPEQVGEARPKIGPLKKVLVTGDSMSMPLDAEVARRLTKEDVEVVRDPHVGTGISQTELLDWAQLSRKQSDDERPDAVVVFMGANEGFPMRDIECCGRDWAAEYAFRTRRVMNTFRRGGAARVYWLTLPAPRDGDRRDIARTVNAAISVAAQPYRAHVRVLDMAAVFTPGFRYRDTIDDKIVREADGIHLNGRGAVIAADKVIAALDADFR